jgi:hypothetical protein
MGEGIGFNAVDVVVVQFDKEASQTRSYCGAAFLNKILAPLARLAQILRFAKNACSG